MTLLLKRLMAVHAGQGRADPNPAPAPGEDARQPVELRKPAPKLRRAPESTGWLVLVDGREAGRVEHRQVSGRPRSSVWKSHPVRRTAAAGTHRTRAEAVARLMTIASAPRRSNDRATPPRRSSATAGLAKTLPGGSTMTDHGADPIMNEWRRAGDDWKLTGDIKKLRRFWPC